MTAFEAITTRVAWYAGEAISKYYAAEYGTGGKLVKATGDGQFAGIVEYGADAADKMVTVVKGVFPGVASGIITAGDKVTIDATKAGQFKAAGVNDVVYGIALNDAAAAGELVSVSMADVATPVITE